MNRLLALTFLVPLTLTSAFAQETAAGTSTITFGVGGAWTLGGRPFSYSGGPVLNGTYEFRFWKYLAAEAGVHNTLQSITQYSSIYTATLINAGTGLYQDTVSTLVTQGSARNTTALFGLRGVRPLMAGKLEVFAGGDSAHTWNAGQGYSGWGVETRLGARFAVDKHHHFWLGTTGEYMHEMGPFPQNWITWTADLGYRFGK
jgi:hypothetical protein